MYPAIIPTNWSKTSPSPGSTAKGQHAADTGTGGITCLQARFTLMKPATSSSELTEAAGLVVGLLAVPHS